MQTCTKLSFAAALAAGLVLGACGGADTAVAPGSESTVSGVASAEVPLSTVTLRDSSSPAQDVTTTLGPDGAFSLDVAALTPPFVLRAEDATGSTRLYAIALRPGVTDVNELSTAAARAASRRDDDGEDDDEDEDDTWDDEGGRRDACLNVARVIRELSTVLEPLFDLYHVTPFTGHHDDGDDEGDDDRDEDANREALRALLRDVSFTVQARSLVVTNRLTGAVIYTAPLKDLTSGTFHPENLPPGPGGTPGTTCSSFTYSAWSPAVCDASGVQTRTVLTSSPTGCTGGSPVLSQTCTPPVPGTCTSFTYSAWSPAVCDASGVQTRSVLTSSPAGCTGGSPVLSQTCTPPLDGAALYQQSCARCHGALATSDLKGKSISVTSIKGAGMSFGRTDAELQAIVTAVGP